MEGEFKNYMLHGPGKITSPEGRTFEGEFEDGKLKSDSIQTHSNETEEEKINEVFS